MPPTRNVPGAGVHLDRRFLREGIGRHDRARGRRAAVGRQRCGRGRDAAPHVLHRSLTPMTPVDATSTCDGVAADSALRGQRRPSPARARMPSGPVHALAQPLLIDDRARAAAGRAQVALETRTGAACAWLVVKTAAADAGTSLTINARSSPPACLDAAGHAGGAEARAAPYAALDRS